MLDRNITMDDVHFAIKNAYTNEVECVYSDYNADKLIFRVRMVQIMNKKKLVAKKTLDQTDEIYHLNGLRDNILDNIILKGVKDINKVNLRKINNQISKSEMNYSTKEKWVLDTMGTNMKDLLALKGLIDVDRTFTNDIMEVYATLGIEAARQTIRRKLERQGKLWIHAFPDLPITRKPTELRMGKGKGSVSYWAMRVPAGRMLFEIEGVSKVAAYNAFRSGAHKLPFRVIFR
jgi:ribosomal protein L16